MGQILVTDSTVTVPRMHYVELRYDADNCDTIINHIDTIYQEVIIKDSIQTIIEYKIDENCKDENKVIKKRSTIKSFLIGLLFLVAII